MLQGGRRSSTWDGLQTATPADLYKLLVEAKGKVVITNQVKFDESLYQYLNRVMIGKHIDDLIEVDILTPEPGQ